MSHEVRLIKLLSGEEVLCDFVEENEKCVKVKHPFTMFATEMGMGSMPWTIATVDCTDRNIFEINKNAIVMITELCNKKIESDYISKISGIASPSDKDKKLILG